MSAKSSTVTTASTPERTNKAVVRRFFEEVLSDGNLPVTDELFAADYTGHDPNLPPLPTGPEGVTLFTFASRTAFPDQRVTVEDLFAEGDRVAVRFTLHGTHLGALLDVAPTGKHLAVQGLAIYRLAGGRIVEGWVDLDMIGLLDQIGLLAQLGAAPSPPPPVNAAVAEDSVHTHCRV